MCVLLVSPRRQCPVLCQCVLFPESLETGWMTMTTSGSIWFSDSRALSFTPAQPQGSSAPTALPWFMQSTHLITLHSSRFYPSQAWSQAGRLTPLITDVLCCSPPGSEVGRAPLYHFTSTCIQLSGLMVMGKCWLFPWQQIPKLTETISLSILKLNSSASMATEVIKRCKLKCCTGMMAWQERHLFWGKITQRSSS